MGQKPVARAGRLARLAVGLGLSLVIATPSPAAADSPMSIQLDAPTAGQTLQAAAVTVSGSVNTGVANVDRVQVVIVRAHDGVKVVDEPACCDGPKNGTIPFSFTTPALTRNGQYHVGVIAHGHLLLNGLAVAPASTDRAFGVAVRPAAPTGLSARPVEGGVRVSWRAVPAYPDLMGYAVYRKVGAGSFAPLAGVAPNTTTYLDDKPPPQGGAVQYRVAALRQGANVSSNANDWLATNSEPVAVELPIPTTTTVPGTGAGTPPPPEVAASGTDLSNFFSNSGGGGGASAPRLPAATVPPAIPDTGFSATLPFPTSPSVTGDLGRLEGRQQGLPSSSSGSAELDAAEDGLDSSNRRALLVPVAAGSVLCVTALHLRWLNRRLALAAGAAGTGAAADATGAASDFEPADLEPVAGDEPFLPPREPVAAGAARPHV